MQDSPKMVFEQLKKIHLFHTDAAGRATISALCRFAQESAGGHAADLGFGMERLAQQSIAWVLREQAIRILRYPLLGEVVRIVTWPTRTERILCHRDYSIHDERGAVVARGTSAWLGLDLETRRPRKADSFFHLPAERMPGPVFDQPLPPLAAPQGECRSDVRTVRASDMDALGHMNNLRYLDWISDHLAGTGLAEPCCGIAIRYVRELKDKDGVLIRHAVTDQGEVLLQMLHRDHGKEVCLARIELGGDRQAASADRAARCPGKNMAG
jgi:medium-chain acyl-[acyl-carrier-protein] hydrolase